jgi:glycosyltransferase involved in cell wall biosynthesis
MRILIASPIRQKPAILKEFLGSLAGLKDDGLDIEFAFIDDNDDKHSSELLQQFATSSDKSTTILDKLDTGTHYNCDETTHYWPSELIWRVALYKNIFIGMAANNGFDYLFLVDSDLVLQPETLRHLVSLEKDIVSEVYWTKWKPGAPALPNVWMAGEYRFDDKFLETLRTPGTYKVGGLGACTLISRYSLFRGVSFDQIPNLDYGGEDRHFCIRATALGLELWADTYYPPVHLYRESDLEKLKQPALAATGTARISLCMIVKNEEEHLPRLLCSVAGLVDEVIIVDTGSTDKTKDIIMSFDAVTDKVMTTVLMEEPWTDDFSKARNVGIDHATGDWILVLDADEELGPGAEEVLAMLTSDENAEGYFVKLINHLGEGDWTELNEDLVFRLFRNRPGYRYRGAIHEQVADLIMEKRGRHSCGIARDLVINHYGFLEETIAGKDKKERNLKMLAKRVMEEPENLLLRYHYGIELLRSERYREALSEFILATSGIDKTISYLPKLVRYIIISLYMGGKPDPALDLVNLGIRLYPRYADLYYHGGLISFAKGDLVMAYDYFKKAIMCPEHPPEYSSFDGVRGYRSFYHLGLISEWFGRHAESLQWFKRCVEERPELEKTCGEAINRLTGAEEGDLARLSDWDLLPVQLSLIQVGAASCDIMGSNGEVLIKGLTPERMREEIIWRSK